MFVDVPLSRYILPPILISPPIPTPPVTWSAPVAVFVEAIADVVCDVVSAELYETPNPATPKIVAPKPVHDAPSFVEVATTLVPDPVTTHFPLMYPIPYTLFIPDGIVTAVQVVPSVDLFMPSV